MKKYLSILMIMVMILTMSTTALAAEDHTTTVSITNANGRTYVGYQLLDLTTSLKTGEHHPNECDGANHSDDCYNYAYTVNDKYTAILQKEVFDNGGNYLWEGGVKPANSGLITKDQILKYLSNQASDHNGTYATMRQVADRIYRAILADNIEADAKNLTGSNDTIAQGYWMFADETDLNNGTNVSNSLVMVDTAGKDAITINPKTALPTVEKKVKDIEDTEDSNIADNEWHDTADHDIGDSVPFKLTATLPSNAQGYQTYKLVFHDTLADSLTLKSETIKVLMYETLHRANADFDLNDGIDVTDKFFKKTTGLADANCNIEVGCDNVFAIEGTTKDSVFVVYYEAVLGENAIIGGNGNTNEVYLEYSNNPYGTGTGTTEIDKVTVFTYQLKINKVDGEGHALAGAEFSLYKKVLGENEPVLVDIDAFNENSTTFTWTGLDDGDYILKETKVPAGYNGMADIEFTITATHTQNEDGTLALTSLDGGKMGLGDIATGVIDENIVNNTGSVLPETGAKGTFVLIFGGATLVMVAAVFMITRKKMSIYED